MFRPDRLSVATRVAVAVTLVLAVGVLVLSGVAYLRVGDRLRGDLDRSLLREAEAYAASVKGDAASLESLKSDTRTYLQGRSTAFSATFPILLVRFTDGRVISNTDLRIETAPANVAALDPAAAARHYIDVTFQAASYRAVTVPVRSAAGTVLAVFEAALPTAPTRDLGYQVLITLIGAGALVTTLGALLAIWAARATLRPLTHAAETAARISKSSLTERIHYEGADDEVGRMVSSINAMLDRLESAFGEQRRFTADASHELRTPLAVISGHVEMLREVEMDEPEREEELSLIADEVARMGRLVDDLLALARLESGARSARQPLELGSLLQETAARGRGLGERHLIVCAEEDLWVDGDPDQLAQALLNLVVNAVAHTTTGGEIRLSALAAAPDHAIIRVEDDGTGIRPEDLPRIFDRFYRAQGKRSTPGGGSGLGLAIAKRLVDLHDGTISAMNRPEGGAAFTITLPRIADPNADDAQSRLRALRRARS